MFYILDPDKLKTGDAESNNGPASPDIMTSMGPTLDRLWSYSCSATKVGISVCVSNRDKHTILLGLKMRAHILFNRSVPLNISTSCSLKNAHSLFEMEININKYCQPFIIFCKPFKEVYNEFIFNF